MTDFSRTELADMAFHVLPAMPCEALGVSIGETRSRRLLIYRREHDYYVAGWDGEAPSIGDRVALHVARDNAVYALEVEITGQAENNRRYLALIGLRRKNQRRAATRTTANELVLVSDGLDIDGELVDISASGLAFKLDSPLTIGTEITAVVNFVGSVFSTRALVRQIQETRDRRYRIGCEFTAIADADRHAIDHHAEHNPLDRRQGLDRDDPRTPDAQATKGFRGRRLHWGNADAA